MSFCCKYNQRIKLMNWLVSEWVKERDWQNPKSIKICLHRFQMHLNFYRSSTQSKMHIVQSARCSRFLREISMFINAKLSHDNLIDLCCGFTTHNHMSSSTYYQYFSITAAYYEWWAPSRREKPGAFSTVWCTFAFFFFYSFLVSNHYMRAIHYHIIDSVNNNIAPMCA